MNNQNGSNMGNDGDASASDRVAQIKEKVRGFVDTAEERAESIKHRAIEAKDDVMSRGNALIERATDMIKANPLKAVGVAFGVGYLGMRLFRR
jgi:ElaB/YqjD/DUF883 family membrane-anchored ribosome-binding protein